MKYNPSYYYQHNPKRQYELHQREKFNEHRLSHPSSNSSSDHEQFSREEWQIVNQAFVQSKKNTCINKRPNLANQQSKQSSLSSDQQKDRILLNPDRSLKMEKCYKKPNQIHTKNKSLSSPTNKASFQSIIKKQSNKIVSTGKINSKPKAQKMKKQKGQKEKKISYGSVSTNHSKQNPKKPKISKKMIQEKQLQKSTVSQQSNEFLVLGEELYDYQDMSKIQTKDFLPCKSNAYQKDLDKKVTFSYYENENGSQGQINPVSSHLNSFVIYDEKKMNKKVHNTIAKIQKYMLGFFEAQGFQEAKQEALQSTQSLSLQAKLQLYNSLLNDSELLKELQNETKQKEIEKIDDVIKLSIDKVEKKSQKLIKQYENQQSLISKWKNSKLHQLSTAKKILEKMVGQEKNPFEQKKWEGQENKWEGSESGSSLRSQIDILDEQNDPILVLQKELESVMNEEYYPQMKKQTINLRRVLNELLKNEHFPQPKLQTESEVTERAKMEDTKNYFTPNGVLWFFEKFFSFIIEKPGYIEELVQKLNEGYGLDVETKQKISRTEDFQKWYDFLGNEDNVNHKPLIEAQLFKEFEQRVIRTDPQIGEEMFEWMHNFNRAIIDCFNEEFHRFRPFYPFGEPVPYLQKAGKYFEITTQSIYYFFEKSKFHVYTNYITFFAGLILPPGHQDNKETRKYNLAKQIKALNQDILYDWDFYHTLQIVAEMSTLEALYSAIQDKIYSQLLQDITVIMGANR